MASRAWLFGLLLVVPLIGLGVAEGIQAHLNSELRSALQDQYPEAMRVHVGIIAAIGLGTLAGVLAMARSTLSLIRKAQTFIIGNALTREQAPQLW